MFLRLQRCAEKCGTCFSECCVAQGLADRIWYVHPSFNPTLKSVGALSVPLLPQDYEGIRLKGLVSWRDAMNDFRCDGRWKWGTKRTTERVSWVGFFVVFQCNRSMLVLHRSRDVSVRYCPVPRYSRCHKWKATCQDLELRPARGSPSLPTMFPPLHAMSWCLNICRQLHNLESRTKAFASVIPPPLEEMCVSPQQIRSEFDLVW